MECWRSDVPLLLPRWHWQTSSSSRLRPPAVSLAIDTGCRAFDWPSHEPLIFAAIGVSPPICLWMCMCSTMNVRVGAFNCSCFHFKLWHACTCDICQVHVMFSDANYSFLSLCPSDASVSFNLKLKDRDVSHNSAVCPTLLLQNKNCTKLWGVWGYVRILPEFDYWTWIFIPLGIYSLLRLRNSISRIRSQWNTAKNESTQDNNVLSSSKWTEKNGTFHTVW